MTANVVATAIIPNTLGLTISHKEDLSSFPLTDL